MNKPRRTGTLFEGLVATYIRPVFPKAERRALRGRNDAGDLVNVEPFMVECKAEKKLDPSTALKEAEAAAKRHGGIPIAIIKRRYQSIGGALVCMTLDTFLHLVDPDRNQD